MANGELSTVIEGVEKLDATTLLKVISSGDCSGLNDKQKVAYYVARCEAAGLDPRSRPFEYMPLQNKLVLYATKAASDQLAGNHGIKTEILSQATDGGIRTVHVRATSRDGKQTEDIGCVSLGNAAGDQLANAMMKAVTKAKRRAILSMCGLGLPDETEVDTIPPGNAPPPLPPPRRKSEAKEVKQVEAVAAVTEPLKTPTPVTVTGDLSEPLPSEEPIIVPDDEEWVKVLDISEKPTKKGGKSYGIKVLSPREPDPFYVNTFDGKLRDEAEEARGANEEVKITRKPREYQGKTYWDVLTLERAPF